VSVDTWARVLWDYHHVAHRLAKSDVIIALGSHDVRVAERAADVFLEGWAPLLVCSGGLGSLTSQMWTRSEAEIFADVAVARGVPRDRILLEDRSTNTGDNVAFTRGLLTEYWRSTGTITGENVDFSRRLAAERGTVPRRAIAVQKPYMERRTFATFRQRWPELDVVVTSPQIAFEAYPTEDIRKDDVINIMVGDLRRLVVYGRKGWSVPQDVPPDVTEAYEGLVAAGYTRRLLPESAG
jgi:uncharacterized SAM-binding protein YcdF (DUF218 family)